MNMTGRRYIAYGSNLNRAQMALRCPDAKVVGTGKSRTMSCCSVETGTGR